jgi:cell division protein FtsN
MQEEASKGQEIMNREKDEDLQEMFDGEPEEENPQPQENQEEKPEPKLEQKEEVDSTADQQSENMEPESLDEEGDQQDPPEAMKDPEVKTEKVELNLGGEEDIQPDTAGLDSNAETATAESDGKADVTGNNSNGLSTYYIIGGSFRVMENAEEHKSELAEKGFDPSIIKMQDTDIHLVTYQGYDNLDSAKKGLADIRQHENSEAWVYKAK